MDEQQYRVLQTIQKIDIFRGLELEEVQRILRVSSMDTREPGQQIYAFGDPSDSMLTVIKGHLIVTSGTGGMLGSITTGMSSGEVGLFTQRPRSANVTATVQTTVLVIQRSDLMGVVEADWKLHKKVLENVVDLLSERLVKANVQIETRFNEEGEASEADEEDQEVESESVESTESEVDESRDAS